MMGEIFLHKLVHEHDSYQLVSQQNVGTTALPVLSGFVSSSKLKFVLSREKRVFAHNGSLRSVMISIWVWLGWEPFACRATSPSGCRATSEPNSFIQSCFKEIFGGGRGDAYTFSCMTSPVSNQAYSLLTCTRSPCRDSHCENGRVRCCIYNLRKHCYLEDVGYRSDRCGVGVIVMVMFLLCGRIAPTLRTQKGADPDRVKTCQSGTRRAERTNKPRTGVASPIDLRTVKCARFFKKRASKTQSTKQSLPIRRAPPSVLIQLKTTPSDYTRVSTCLSAESESDQVRSPTRASTFILKISDSEATMRHLLKDHPESV